MLHAIAAAVLIVAAGASAEAPEPFVERDVAVRMRDGAVLRADVFRPAEDGSFPVLVYRTPYDRRRAPESYTTFRRAVERGYAVVVQDVRGRYASEGEFEPYRHEGPDGFDTIEWAAAQPWANGSVGTFGLSYPGAVQWLAAVLSPPHLKAMVPAMTFSTPRNFVYSGGVFDLSWTAWIWNNIAPDVRIRKGLRGPRTVEDARAEWERIHERVRSRLPLDALEELKDVAPYYYDWMRHPPGDAWWDWCELRDKYARVGAAVLNLSGWHDEAYGPEGAMTNFDGLVASRAGQPDKRTQLVIGPWVHGVGSIASTTSGDRDFGASARLDYDELVLRFLDRYVRGIDNGVDREKPVRFFVMGENAWREADALPLPGTKPTPLHLAGSGRLSWAAPAEEAGSSPLASDPARPLWDPFAATPGAHDYRGLAQRPDVLVFETPPLESDLAVVGALSAEVFVSCDAPDTDLWVKVYDVAADGTAFNLMSPGLDLLRASYREGGPERKLLSPGRVHSLRFENLRTANLFEKGHRIRVVLATSFLPHFSRSLHTGMLETASSEMRPATLRIHHDARRPSRLVLPVVAR